MIRVSSFGDFQNSWRDEYILKIKRLIPFEWKQIDVRRMPDTRTTQLLPEEKKFLEEHSKFILLDAGGKEMSSEDLATWLFKSGDRHFVIGPAIGFHPDFYQRAESKISLSKLTFTHALAQVILAESLYRSACILKNHPFVK